MLWCQVAELDIFQLEVFAEIYFRKQVCLEGTSLHGLLTCSGLLRQQWREECIEMWACTGGRN